MLITLDELRRFTVARNFFGPTTLKRALEKMGFVQADPIRAPARAQDLILRHRVRNYHAGDLEKLYATLDIEEDVFVTYGFVTRPIHALMHPRLEEKSGRTKKAKGDVSKTQLLLEFVRARGAVHPREVDEHFLHGTVKNNWGGSSSATTYLLEAMHYRGLLRVARRDNGIRIYSAHGHNLPSDAIKDAGDPARLDALVDLVVRIYAPLPDSSLLFYVRRLRYAAPQWQAGLTSALQRARERLSHTRIEGVDWYWPADEEVAGSAPQNAVRFLAPFDPVVHDRARFERLWGWAYRFEAYTPVSKRKLGYYAMPLLWREHVIGWANLSAKNEALTTEFGYVGSPPRDRKFKRELEAEVDRMRAFLGVA